MPDVTKLRVLPRGTALCPNFEAVEAGRNAFIGRDCRAIGPEVDDMQLDARGRVVRQKVKSAVFVTRVGEVVTVPNRKEYRDAVRDGDLWAADLETAQACGVAFDPKFGDEHTDEVKAKTEEAVKKMWSPSSAEKPVHKPGPPAEAASALAVPVAAVADWTDGEQGTDNTPARRAAIETAAPASTEPAPTPPSVAPAK